MATPSHDRLHLSCWVAAGFMPRPFQYRAGCSQDAGQVLHPVCPTSSPHRRACPLHRLVATSACRHAAHRQPSARISSAQRSLANRAFSTSSRACCRRRILDAAAGRICASVFSRLLRLLLLARSAIVGPHLGWQSARFSRSCCRASFVEFLQGTRDSASSSCAAAATAIIWWLNARARTGEQRDSRPGDLRENAAGALGGLGWQAWRNQQWPVTSGPRARAALACAAAASGPARVRPFSYYTLPSRAPLETVGPLMPF
jgi:hypothetical protein